MRSLLRHRKCCARAASPCGGPSGAAALARGCWGRNNTASGRTMTTTTTAAAGAAGQPGGPTATTPAASAQQQQQQRAAAPHAATAATESIFYSAYPLDRAAHLRQDADMISRLLTHPAARLLPVSGSRVLLVDRSTHASTNGQPATDAGSGGGFCGSSGNSSNGQGQQQQQQQAALQLAWLSPASDALPCLDPDVPPLFLGLCPATGTPHFAGAAARTGSAAETLAADVAGARWAPARAAGPALAPGEAALAATACGLAQWHAASLHEGGTGERTAGAEGGFARRVPSTGRGIYPRIDPAIITLVTAGDWALLGRKAEWPAGRYSTLAGFLEVGETLEQALAREVEEESGVRVAPDTISYVASQPWPFPRSLMVGFTAQAAAAAASSGSSGLDLLKGPARAAALDVGIKPHEIEEALLPLSRLPTPIPQPGEMEDVRWFHRDWILAATGNGRGAVFDNVGAATAAAAEAGGASAPSAGSNNGGSGEAAGERSGGGDVNAGPGADLDLGAFEIPGSYSLAHRLITGWLLRGGGSSGAVAAGGERRPWAGDAVPQVSLASGTQKYVLMRLHNGAPPGAPLRSKLLVWGHPAAAYHNHIYQRARAFAGRLGLECEVLGGGRIEHRPEEGAVAIYGYSAAFGPAPHEVSAALVRRWLPFYNIVTVSYDGY